MKYFFDNSVRYIKIPLSKSYAFEMAYEAPSALAEEEKLRCCYLTKLPKKYLIERYNLHPN